jgi:hypothetical protein
MSPEKYALILALERIIYLEQKVHEMEVTLTALARAFRDTSQLGSDPLADRINDVREGHAQYAPDALVRTLTELIQNLRG